MFLLPVRPLASIWGDGMCKCERGEGANHCSPSPSSSSPFSLILSLSLSFSAVVRRRHRWAGKKRASGCSRTEDARRSFEWALTTKQWLWSFTAHPVLSSHTLAPDVSSLGWRRKVLAVSWAHGESGTLGHTCDVCVWDCMRECLFYSFHYGNLVRVWKCVRTGWDRKRMLAVMFQFKNVR